MIQGKEKTGHGKSNETGYTFVDRMGTHKWNTDRMDSHRVTCTKRTSQWQSRWENLGARKCIKQTRELKSERTDKGEAMPRKLADAIDVGCHEGHDLSLRGKVVILSLSLGSSIFLDTPAGRSDGGWASLFRWGNGGGGHVFSHECLCEEGSVELGANPHLQS
jgi:hypothetical protein